MKDYPKPALTADAVVITGSGASMKLLVIQRENPPFQGQWAFPGGFAECGEPVLETCVRELGEETGLSLDTSQGIPLMFRAKKGRDPRGWTVSQPVLFYLEEEPEVRAADDAACAQFTLLSELEQLSFDHGAILCEAIGRFWPEMPGFDSRLEGVQPWGRPQDFSSPEVVFFGGTFNPWHEGHSACVQLAPQDLPLIVVPDTNPFKIGMEQPCFWKHFREIHRNVPPQVAIYSGFCGMETANPTYAWLSRTRWERRNLIIGDDCFNQVHLWFESQKLLRGLSGLYVVPRGGSNEAFQKQRDRIWVLAPELHIERLPGHRFQNQSSSGLRGNIKK